MSTARRNEATIAEIGRQFFKYAMDGLSIHTQNTYRVCLRGFLQKFGRVRPSQLSVLEFTIWMNDHKEWKSSSSGATVIRSIKRLFNWALRNKLIKRNPLLIIRQPGYT